MKVLPLLRQSNTSLNTFVFLFTSPFHLKSFRITSLTAKSFLLGGIVFVNPANRHQVSAPKLQKGVPLYMCTAGNVEAVASC